MGLGREGHGRVRVGKGTLGEGREEHGTVG